MNYFKISPLILFVLLSVNYVKGQKSNQDYSNISIKTIGLIDAENIYTLLQERYIDSLLSAFHQKSSIRIVIISSDSVHSDRLFLDVRKAWGYTDTEIRNDLSIVMSSQPPRSIGFFDHWIYSIIPEDSIDALIKNYWWPDFKAKRHFTALENLLNKLLPEIERGVSTKKN